jgi:aspartyl-tRNA(Asn)/glutamyl-tRNA(Gln) amidotransferase subunit A
MADSSGTPRTPGSDLIGRTAAELADLVRSGEVSAVEVTEAHLERVDALEGRIRAFLHRMDDDARQAAAEIDAARSRGEDLGPLAGVPVAVKDLFCTRGVPTTAGSRILEGWRPPYDATVIARLRQAGAVIVGKTNMDEFAMGSSTENSGFFPTANPWDLSRVPGGSSGGSAAAVAAGFSPLALGTDTGGSIRQPAALCGVVAYASSLDQVGPFATDVAGAALLLEAIWGHDPADSTSIPTPPEPLLLTLDGGVEGMRVGVVTELTEVEGIQPEVAAAVESARRLLEKAGAVVETVSVPSVEYGLSAYYIIAPAEASSNLARYDGVRYGLRAEGADVGTMNAATREAGFGAEVKRRIMLGTYALSAGYYDAYYGQAQRVRTLIIRDFARAYERFDVLLSPTSPTTAFPLGAKTGDPLAMYLSDICTIPTNLAGATAISVPAGLDREGLPIGVQVLAPALGEAVMFRVARALEAGFGFDARPNLEERR